MLLLIHFFSTATSRTLNSCRVVLTIITTPPFHHYNLFCSVLIRRRRCRRLIRDSFVCWRLPSSPPSSSSSLVIAGRRWSSLRRVVLYSSRCCRRFPAYCRRGLIVVCCARPSVRLRHHQDRSSLPSVNSLAFIQTSVRLWVHLPALSICSLLVRAPFTSVQPSVFWVTFG